MIYAVIDTNVIVSALITKHSDAATYKVLTHITHGDVVPLYNNEIINEYRDVLSRGKFHLTQTEIERIIGYFYAYGIMLDRSLLKGSCQTKATGCSTRYHCQRKIPSLLQGISSTTPSPQGL